MISLLTAIAVGMASMSGSVPPIVKHAQKVGIKPCAHEDGAGPCYWNARKRGNSKGRSFIVTTDGDVLYRYSK
jgi:hypothetical protein